MSTTVLSLEAAVMTAHDWVEHQMKAPVAELGTDLSNPNQPILFVDRADGEAIKEIREWTGDAEEAIAEFHDTWYHQNPDQQYETIVRHTKLVETEVLGANGDIPDGGVTIESLSELSATMRTSFTANGFSRAISSRFQALAKSFDLYRLNRLRTKEFSADLLKGKRVANKATSIPYTTLAELNFYCPPGQSVSTLELLEVLLECQEYSEELVHGAIRPFMNWLTQNCVKPDGFATAANELAIDVKDPSKLARRLGMCLSRGNQVEQKFANLFEKASDYPNAFDVSEKLLSKFKSYPSSQVAEDVAELSTILCQVADQLQREAIGKITTAKGVAIADYIFTLAKAVEFYSVYATVLRATMVALEDSTVKMEEILNRK